MRRLLTLTIIFTYLLIVFGATVRVFGAGLACPDWPLCHGQWIPPFDLPVVLEWGHRLLASVVGAATLMVATIACTRAYRTRLGQLGVAALLFVIAQAVLGGLTVLKLLHFSTVTLHLATGFFFLGVLLWMRLRLSTAMFAIALSPHNRAITGLALVLLYGQVILGGLVSSNYAGLACPDFPTCGGAWVPPLHGLVAIHFFHRVLALLVVGLACWAAVVVARQGIRRGRWVAVGLMVGMFLQLGLGISNVLLQLPKAVTIAHTGLAAGLFALLVAVNYMVRHASISPTHQTAH